MPALTSNYMNAERDCEARRHQAQNGHAATPMASTAPAGLQGAPLLQSSNEEAEAQPLKNGCSPNAVDEGPAVSGFVEHQRSTVLTNIASAGQSAAAVDPAQPCGAEENCRTMPDGVTAMDIEASPPFDTLVADAAVSRRDDKAEARRYEWGLCIPRWNSGMRVARLKIFCVAGVRRRC